MRKAKMLTGLFFLFLSLLAAARGESADNGVLMEEIRRVIPQIKVKYIEYNPDLKMYEIMMESSDALIYVTQDFRYSFVGTVIDIQGRRNLTEERLTDWRRVDLSGLDFNNGFQITKGNRRVALFVDPNCPYCKKLLGEIKQVQDVGVYVFLYPILGPESRQKSSAIWNAGDKWKALLSDDPGNFPAGHDPAEENLVFGRQHGINSVPTMILEDGRMLKGFMTASRIESYLSQATSSRK
jgi:thiol:disulfide interchange protein DsbC